MTIAQIHLTDLELETLEGLARQAGKTEEQILQEAIQEFIHRARESELQNRLALLRQAKGIWQERLDLPDSRELRREFDRH
jgi:HPt (histidine-containing phosphotransfer) domain-containing protein